MNLTAVAKMLAVHLSNATRTGDSVVNAGLVERQQPDDDRRHLVL